MCIARMRAMGNAYCTSRFEHSTNMHVMNMCVQTSRSLPITYNSTDTLFSLNNTGSE